MKGEEQNGANDEVSRDAARETGCDWRGRGEGG